MIESYITGWVLTALWALSEREYEKSELGRTDIPLYVTPIVATFWPLAITACLCMFAKDKYDEWKENR